MGYTVHPTQRLSGQLSARPKIYAVRPATVICFIIGLKKEFSHIVPVVQKDVETMIMICMTLRVSRAMGVSYETKILLLRK